MGIVANKCIMVGVATITFSILLMSIKLIDFSNNKTLEFFKLNLSLIILHDYFGTYTSFIV